MLKLFNLIKNQNIFNNRHIKFIYLWINIFNLMYFYLNVINISYWKNNILCKIYRPNNCQCQKITPYIFSSVATKNIIVNWLTVSICISILANTLSNPTFPVYNSGHPLTGQVSGKFKRNGKFPHSASSVDVFSSKATL